MNKYVSYSLQVIAILAIWLVLIFKFPNELNNMNEKTNNDKIHWVVDEDTGNSLATHKTLEDARLVKAEYPYNKIIILKQIE